jgi:prolipoprotein diacylglyceryltransferase
MTLAIFGVLLWWFPRKRRDGDIFLGYLGLYAVGRFSVEFLRGDENRGFVFHHLLSTSQFIALLVLAGIASVFMWRRFHHGEKRSTVAGSIEKKRASRAGKSAPKGGLVPGGTAGGLKAGRAASPSTGHGPKRTRR